jgi:hypothetical protein
MAWHGTSDAGYVRCLNVRAMCVPILQTMQQKMQSDYGQWILIQWVLVVA